MTRIFLVDDHAVLREGLRLLLTREADLCIVGEAANGQQLLEQLPTVPTDVVLLDMHMPVLDGLATTRQLHEHYPALRVLALSMVDEPLSINQVLAAGAQGYLLKNADRTEILAGIQLVMAGQRFLCSEVGLALLEAAVSRSAPPVGASPLSRREQEVLQLVAGGFTTLQIAEQLFTSKRTVETHRQNMLEKTGCKNTAALISYALRHQLLPAPPAAGGPAH